MEADVDEEDEEEDEEEVDVMEQFSTSSLCV
jgi:hypothetical protein